MSKTYYNAYQLGQQDGINGHNRLPFRSFTRMLTNIGVYLPGAANRDDEWLKGYRAGFEDSIRKINIGDDSMSKINDWDHQISVATSLWKVIDDTANLLDDVKNQLQQLVNGHSDLMQGNFFVFCENHIKPRIKNFSDLIIILQQTDSPAVQKMIQGLTIGRGSKYATAAVQHNISSILSAVGQINLGAAVSGGQKNDLSYQLSIINNLIGLMNKTNDAVNVIQNTFTYCISEHKNLMVQYFGKFTVNNAAPRVQTLRAIMNNIDGDINELKAQKKAIEGAMSAY
jgi:nucleoid DNA-binding protein